jgi:hypothetical protein
MAARLTALGLSAIAMVCWGVMFLAGTDVWHDVGRPDIWSLKGPPYADVRAFGLAFYALFVVLAVHMTVAGWSLLVTARSGRSA